MSVIIVHKDMIPMKVIGGKKGSEEERAYIHRPPEETHTKEELEALHRAIRYTQMYKQAEARAKMDEESVLEMPLLTNKELRELGK